MKQCMADLDTKRANVMKFTGVPGKEKQRALAEEEVSKVFADDLYSRVIGCVHSWGSVTCLTAADGGGGTRTSQPCVMSCVCLIVCVAGARACECRAH